MEAFSSEFMRAVAELLERGLPLEPRPFAGAADDLGAGEADVTEAAAMLKSSGMLRHLGAFVDFRPLGLTGYLCAARTDGYETEEICSWLGCMNNVTHIYERGADINLWFTAILRDDGAARDLSDQLTKRCCPHALLAAVRRVKLRASFASECGAADDAAEPEASVAPDVTLTARERAILCASQADFILTSRPFAEIGKLAGYSEEEVLLSLRDLADKGVLRRFGASLHHRKAGYLYNSLVSFDLSDLSDQAASETARISARRPWVSHCYVRRALVNTFGGDWRYNLYMMIHATTEDELSAREAALSSELEGRGFLSMRTVRERKKTVYLISEEVGL